MMPWIAVLQQKDPLNDLRTMYTSCWEQAEVQTCYVPHLTTLPAMGYRRGLRASTPETGAQGRRAHSPGKTTITCFSREASTVCPWGQKGEKDHRIKCSKWPRCSHLSRGREGRWKQQVPQHLSCESPAAYPCGHRPHSVETGDYSFPFTHLLLLIGKRGHLASFTRHR